MPVEKKIKSRLTEEKSVDLFLDRLVEILLLQLEQESAPKQETKNISVSEGYQQVLLKK
jgi:hypothetical protein